MEAVEAIKTDDIELLQLGFDWMKIVRFNDPTISLKEAVLPDVIAKVSENVGASQDPQGGLISSRSNLKKCFFSEV